MKDSGIPWVGSIPTTWDVVQLSSIFKEHKDKNKLLEENNLLSLSYGRIIRKDINTKEGLLPQSFDGYNIIQKGDIVFRLTDLQNDKRSLRTGLCKEKGIITSAYISIRKTQELHSEFFHYLLHSYDECKVFYGLGDGVRQGMTFDDLRKLLLVVPPYQLQQQIANFLDKKCADIDQLITLQQQMIGELKAYKQSVITEAVCKGLDKSVPMKDSGIEWIGEVPEGWKITKLKNVSKLKTGGTPNGYDNQSDFTTRKPWFTPSDFNENYKLIQSNRFLNLEVIENEKIILFPKHTVLMVCIGTVGKVGILTEEGYCNQQVTAIIPNGRMLPEYILYTLIAENKIIRDLANYTILPIINNSFLKEIILVCPTFEEQKNIVAFIEHKSSQIDTLISIKQQKINELKEYKKSMIYEYITGKKQVPNE